MNTDLKNTIAKITNEHVGREVYPIKPWYLNPDLTGEMIIEEYRNQSSLDGAISLEEMIDYALSGQKSKLEQRLAVMREALDKIVGACDNEQYKTHSAAIEAIYLSATKAIKQSEGGV